MFFKILRFFFIIVKNNNNSINNTKKKPVPVKLIDGKEGPRS